MESGGVCRIGHDGVGRRGSVFADISLWDGMECVGMARRDDVIGCPFGRGYEDGLRAFCIVCGIGPEERKKERKQVSK